MKRLNVKFHDREMNTSLPGDGVLTAIVGIVDRTTEFPGESETIDLSLSGLDTAEKQHLEWGRFELSPGDVVTITVHDDRISDPPDSRSPSERNAERSLRKRQQYVREMAAEWGWRILEPKSAGDG